MLFSDLLESTRQDVKLYHYNKKHFDVLKSLSKQGKKPKSSPNEDRTIRVGEYGDHISFFIEPVPIDILGTIFGDANDVWKTGNKLYEHVVKLSDIKYFKYEFVEVPEKTKMLVDDSIDVDEFYERLNKLNKDEGYIGSSVAKFIKCYNKFEGTTREAYIDAYELRRKYPKLSGETQYAACVPHVMIYPSSGEIPVDSAHVVTISANRLSK